MTLLTEEQSVVVIKSCQYERRHVVNCDVTSPNLTQKYILMLIPSLSSRTQCELMNCYIVY